MKSQFEKEIKFCKFFLILITITCSIYAYNHRNDNSALISLAIFIAIFGGITLYALIVRVKYLKEIKNERNRQN